MSCGCGARTGKTFDPDCEGPSEDDLRRFGGEYRDCPHCGAEIYDEAPFCHACGRAIADAPSAPGGPKAAIMGLSVAALIAALVLWSVL